MSVQKQKGTRHETKITTALREYGIGAYRPAQAGFKDLGDVHGVSPFIIQAKDWKDTTAALREGVDGAVKQAGNANELYGVAVIKRARKPIGEAYAVLRLEDLARVILRLRRAENAVESDDDLVRLIEQAEADKARPFPKG